MKTISKQTQHLDIAKIFLNSLLDPVTQQKIIDMSEEAYHEPSVQNVKRSLMCLPTTT